MTGKIFYGLYLCLLFFFVSDPLCSDAQIDKKETANAVVRGKDLLSRSPVCYYYDLLSHDLKYDLGSYFFPEVVFVPGWGEWVVGEDKNGQKIEIVVTDTVPNSVLKDNYEYHSYLSKNKLRVNEDGDMLEIESFRASTNDPYLTIKAKLFFDNNKEPLLGVTYSYDGRYVGSEGAFYFYSFKGNNWMDITNTILPIPDTSIFFDKPINMKLIRKYIYLGIYANFYTNSDTVNLYARNISDFDCEDCTNISRANKEKLCDDLTLLKQKGVYYLFDRQKNMFKRVNMY